MQSDITAEKSALRDTLRGMTPPRCSHLTERFLALEEVAGARAILLFWGMERETDTRLILSALLARGKKICLPRCLPGRMMEARIWTGRERLLPSGYGIPEPGLDCPVLEKEDIDVILVPNLCCDREGYRLGQGGGYYDRYLSDYRGLTVAICPGAVLQEQLPREEHDVPVKLLLTDG